MFKYLGLLTVLISWAGGAYIVTKWRGTRVMSISDHAATTKLSSLLLGTVLIVDGGLFYIWLLGWFMPKLGIGDVFTLLLTLAFTAQIIAGLVPDIAGIKRLIHRAAAYSLAALFLPLGWLMLRAPNISSLGRAIGIACFSWLIVSVLLFLFVPKSKNHYLIFQALYIAVFQLQILAIAYTL